MASAAVGGVVHIEETVGAVVRMKRQTEQALFGAVEVGEALDVEKVPCQERSVLDNADGAALLDDKETIVVGRTLEVERAAESGDDGRQREGGRRRRGRRGVVVAAGGEEKGQENEEGEEQGTAGHWGRLAQNALAD